MLVGCSEPQYVATCKDSFNNANKNFRVSYTYRDQGEAHRYGEPDKTTGYYQRFSTQVGASNNSLTCYSGTNGNFIYAYLNTGDGSLYYDVHGTISSQDIRIK
jgi:hypothetical protein